MEGNALTTVLGYVGNLGSTFFNIAGQAVDFVMEHPIALIPICSMLIVTGIGVARSMIKGV